jgi:hypothetical protein
MLNTLPIRPPDQSKSQGAEGTTDEGSASTVKDEFVLKAFKEAMSSRIFRLMELTSDQAVAGSIGKLPPRFWTGDK